MLKGLRGCRIAVLVTDGFELVELVVPVRALRVAGAEVDIGSLRQGRLRGMNLHEPAVNPETHRPAAVQEGRTPVPHFCCLTL